MKVVVVRKHIAWYVKLVAANGETAMTSETYYSKGNAERAAERLRSIMTLR